MFDRTTQDNDLRRAMNACLPGLENKPGFEREVLKRARGEIKVKKKLSVGLVFILILVLAAVTALAATLLTAQQIIQQEGLSASSDTGDDLNETVVFPLDQFLQIEISANFHIGSPLQ